MQSNKTFKNLDIAAQVATPYSTGTGFYWSEVGYFVTCEHIVRDNKEVILQWSNAEKLLAKVFFTDPVYDVAFLKIDDREINKKTTILNTECKSNSTLTAIGFTPNTHLKKEELKLISSNFRYEGRDYYLLDTEIESDYTGGPLLNEEGDIVGMNIGFFAEEDYQLALSSVQLRQVYEDFLCGEGKVGTRCYTCEHTFFEGEIKRKQCPKCKDYLILPTQVKEFEPSGVGYTIERLIEKTGHSKRLSRRGPNNWQIAQGSARINISYYEKNGLITGDAHLCLLPEDEQDVLEFLLEQNQKIEGLSFSIDHHDIILSLLIHDQYLNVETGVKLFKHLFEQADYYDNILVDRFGAKWYSDQVIFD